MRYVMVTHWDNHWDNLPNKKTLFTESMFRKSMNKNNIEEYTEALFIKKNRDRKTVEGCWSGKVYDFKNTIYRGLSAISFRVGIEKKIECPSKYLDYHEGWYCEDLVAKKDETSSKEIVFPHNMTISWLLKNIPIGWWAIFSGCLITAFTLGVGISGIPKIKNMLRYIPGYKVDFVLPAETTKHIEQEIAKLIDSHNMRLAKLQDQLLSEERLGADHTLLSAYQDNHQKGAQRIKDLINDENNSFQNELKVLKETFE